MPKVIPSSPSAPAAATCSPISHAVPSSIDVVDLNPNHVALNRLKLAAFRHLPDHAAVVHHFAQENTRSNSRSYDRFIAPNLDAQTRDYWNKRGVTGRRRIAAFNRNFYRTGLLGRFIGAGHIVARLHGVKLTDITETRSLREQRPVLRRPHRSIVRKAADPLDHRPQKLPLRPRHSAATV